MKRLDLLRRVADEGAVFIRHGADHDVYRNVITGVIESIPRHREISERLALKIIRRLSAPSPDAQP